jgi:hypothetical protein
MKLLKTFIILSLCACHTQTPSEPEPQKQETEVSRLQERKGEGQGELYECKPQVTIKPLTEQWNEKLLKTITIKNPPLNPPLTDYEKHKKHMFIDGIIYNKMFCKWCREHPPKPLQQYPRGL